MKKWVAVVLVVLVAALMPATVLAAASISLDKTNYQPNELIRVTVTGITQEMFDNSAYVGIYPAGGAHDDWGEWSRPDVGTSQLTFNAPPTPGSYEMRLYDRDYVYTDETLVMRVPFTVGDLQKQGKIALARNAYQANEEIPVMVSDITAEMEQAGAFIAAYIRKAPSTQRGGNTSM